VAGFLAKPAAKLIILVHKAKEGLLSSFGGPEFWLFAVVNITVFILSLTVHEYAHARVAYLLGDDTAARRGRMSLNPVVHIDPVGTILMPLVGTLSNIPVIGWAKPVPVTPMRLTRRFSMRTGHALVAAAGPLSNLALALFCTALLWLLLSTPLVPEFGARVAVQALLSRLVLVNVGLAIFNLLPVPPLDGSRLLPRSLDGVMAVVERYSFLIFVGIIMFGRTIIAIPFQIILALLGSLFGLDLWQIYRESAMLVMH
jgi:Zn-dependent protease